ATHAGDREWRVEILSAEYLHGEEAGAADDGECFARAGGDAGDWAGELFSAAGQEDTRRNYWRSEGRPVRNRVPRARREPGDGRLLARRVRNMDFGRRTDVSGGGNHRGGKSERHVPQHFGDWERSGVPGLGCISDHSH